jgi:PAS domain S-box-containing protein/excisionase family DNA binding protein
MSGDSRKNQEPVELARGDVSTDRVTMAEAARLKGVSYHTVSRAVRRGKLPVLRLGRMALISMGDLQAWQPMKERAPRMYRRKQQAVQAANPLHLIDVSHIELARRLAAFYELTSTIATEGSLGELAEVVTMRFSEVMHLQRAALWQFDLEAGLARRLGYFHEPVFDLPTEVPIDSVRVLEEISACPHARVIDERESEFYGLARNGPSRGHLLVAPMVHMDKVLGVIVGDWKEVDPGEIRDEMLQLADVIAMQVAIALDNVMRRDQENRRRLMLEAMLDDLNGAVSAFDHRGRLTYINEAELHMFDLWPDEVWVGQDMRDFVSRKRRVNLNGLPIDVDDNPLVRALRGERLQDLRQIVVRKNGERRYVQTSSRPVFVNGELAGAVSVTRDVTHEREADLADKRYLEQLEHALRRSQAIANIVVEINETRSSLDVELMTQFAIDRIAMEFDAYCGMLWILGTDQRFHLAATNNVADDDVGETSYTPDEFAMANDALTRNKPVLLDANTFHDPEMPNRVRDELTHVLVIPMRIRGQRTGVAYLGFQELPAIDPSDEIFASVWGRQCAQAIDTALLFHQVESAHGRLVGVIDQLPQAVVIVDAETESVTVANRAAEALWARSVDEGTLVAQLAILNTENERLEGPHHPLLRPINTGQQIVSEPLLIPQPDGSQIEVLANHAPILDARMAVVGSVSVLQNRADFKTLDRAKDEFISVVAHELRNPLTSLRGNLQLLQRRLRKREGAEAEEERQRVVTAIQQVDRVSDLVGRMLDVSRVDLGSLDVSPGISDAVSLLREVVDSAVTLEPSREFRVDAPESMPVVWDAARIHQVLSNLMQNAARYAPGTLVEITMEERPDDHIRITVRDHGPGVPLAIRRRLFKQYYRFDDGQDDAPKSVAHDGSRGLGIGLYISARLVKAHRGTMRVDNAPDGGAVFTLDLPRDASDPTA